MKSPPPPAAPPPPPPKEIPPLPKLDPPPIAPEPSEPSGYVLALLRLADLEAQMESSFAKHVQLQRTQKHLQAQYEVLKDLPVGLDALQDELVKKEKEPQQLSV
jgi:hypothetical protein